MDKKKKNVLNRFLSLFLFLFSLTVLFFLLRHIGFDKVAEAFKSVGLLGAVLLILLGICENASDALGLYFAVLKKTRFIRVFASNCIGALTNVLIPWEAGEVVKVALLKENGGFANSIKGVVLWNCVYKLSKTLALLLILALSLIIGRAYKMEHFTVVLLASLIGFLPYFGMMLLIRANSSVKIVNLLKLLGKKDVDSLKKRAEDIDKSLKKFKKEEPENYKKLFLSQFFGMILAWITFVLCAYLVGCDYSFSTLSLAYCAVSSSVYIVSFIPMKIGVGEGVGFFIFSFLGLDGGSGLLITFILRIKSIITTSLASSLIIVDNLKAKE